MIFQVHKDSFNNFIVYIIGEMNVALAKNNIENGGWYITGIKSDRAWQVGFSIITDQNEKSKVIQEALLSTSNHFKKLYDEFIIRDIIE